MPCLKASLAILLFCLSGCSWFHAKKPLAPEPPQLIVNGAPAASLLFIDGSQAGRANDTGDRPQVLKVTPGSHTLEVRLGEKVVYRESLDIEADEKRMITVLSGASRN